MRDPRRGLAQLAVAVMTADGRVNQFEIAAVSRLESLGLGSLAQVVQNEMESVVQGTAIDVVGSCEALGSLRPEWAAAILSTLASIATSDREVSIPEVETLTAIGLGFGLPETTTQEILRLSAAGQAGKPTTADSRLASTTTPIAWASRTMGIEPAAGVDELNARYFDLVRTFDPAKMIDLGPEFVVLAVHRLSDVTAAYQVLVSRKASR